VDPLPIQTSLQLYAAKPDLTLSYDESGKYNQLGFDSMLLPSTPDIVLATCEGY